MSELSEEDMELWLRANKDTKRLEKQNVIKPDLSSKPKARKNKDYVISPKNDSPRQRKKSMTEGRFKYDAMIDLHGCTLQSAHDTTITFIKDCYRLGRRHVMVITGHGDGPTSIKREFCIWMEESSIKKYVISVQEAHFRQGGAGAYYVVIKRNANG